MSGNEKIFDLGAVTDIFRSATRRTIDRKIGIEIERIGFWPEGKSLQFSQTSPERPGARDLLEGLYQKFRWEPSRNIEGVILGFESPYGKVSLEPGSQLELSTHVAPHLFSLNESISYFEKDVDSITQPWGLTWFGMGCNPIESPEDKELIPSPRYRVMTNYMKTRGKLALWMMRLTSSVQVNLDYTSEIEAIEMLRVSLAAVPVCYALFGNSPISEGRRTGFSSFRSEIWRHTDSDRTGILESAFHPDFSFANYAALLWKMPLMFVQDRNENYTPSQGASLSDLIQGRLPNVDANEANVMSAIRQMFTEVRLKPGYLEIRCIDGQPPALRMAATAFLMGILYSGSNRRRILNLLGNLTNTERRELLFQSSVEGLSACFGKQTLREIAIELLELAKKSLVKRAWGEELFLKPLEVMVNTGRTPSSIILSLINQDGLAASEIISAFSKLSEL